MSGRTSLIGVGQSKQHVIANLNQALAMLEAFDYATDDVMLDAWRLVHKLLDEAQSEVRGGVARFLSEAAAKADEAPDFGETAGGFIWHHDPRPERKRQPDYGESERGR